MVNKMKIMFYINSLSHGGAERVMCNLANFFASKGHDCTLVTSFKQEWEYECDKKVKRINLFETYLKGVLKRNYRLTKALRKTLKTDKPDVLISFMAEPNFRALFATIGLKTKTVISIRNDPNKEYPNFIFRFLAKHLYKRADGVVFQTEDAKRWFPKSIQKKSTIIFNPVNQVFFETAFDGDRKNIVTTGRLVPQKNHELLIKAFSLIASQIEENLYIYGEGELRTKLEGLVKKLNLEDRVFLPGAVKDVANTIKSAKLFVLSSDYEGMPNALMEALTLGIPCISTDCPCGGSKMLIENGVNGILVSTNCEQELADKMLYILSNYEKAKFMGENSKVRAEEYRNDNICMQWEVFVKKEI